MLLKDIMTSDCIEINLQLKLLPFEEKGPCGKERTSMQPILVRLFPSLTSLYIKGKPAFRMFLVFCLFSVSFKIKPKDIKKSLRFIVCQVCFKYLQNHFHP